MKITREPGRQQVFHKLDHITFPGYKPALAVQTVMGYVISTRREGGDGLFVTTKNLKLERNVSLN